MRNVPAILALALILAASQATAQEFQDDWRYGVEGSLLVDVLTNNHGVWEGVDGKLFWRPNPRVVAYVNPMFWARDGEVSGMAGVGVSVEWLPIFYTTSSAYSGTNDPYNPLLRLDHDFNLKLGPEGFLVLTAGLTYLKYHVENWDIAPYLGVAAYLGRWALSYRLAFNVSNPGSRFGMNHVLTAEYGIAGAHSTYLSASYGQGGYTATYMAIPEAIYQDAVSVAVGHRHYLSNNWGLFGEFNFLWWENAYEKYGFLLGAFYTWGTTGE